MLFCGKWPVKYFDSELKKVLGDLSEGDPPVPIPNTEVKPFSPDCTARASVWESRKLPGLSEAPAERLGLLLFLERGRPRFTRARAYPNGRTRRSGRCRLTSPVPRPSSRPLESPWARR